MPTTSLSYHPADWSKRIQSSRLFRPLLVTVLLVFTPIAAMANTHSHLSKTPCDIRLVFGNDERGMPTVAYKLFLQIRNNTSRDIAGVSVYWLNNESAIIGNSAAICGVKNVAVGPSESGPCETIVQQVSGALLQKLGQATWTKIINHELTNFQKVEQCSIIGYSYSDRKVKTY